MTPLEAFLLGVFAAMGLGLLAAGLGVWWCQSSVDRCNALFASVLRGLSVADRGGGILVQFEGERIAISFETLARSIEHGHLCSMPPTPSVEAPRFVDTCTSRLN